MEKNKYGFVSILSEKYQQKIDALTAVCIVCRIQTAGNFRTDIIRLSKTIPSENS